MDELQRQIGAAVSALSSARPDPLHWAGAAAQALTQTLDEISRELGALIFEVSWLPKAAEVPPVD